MQQSREVEALEFVKKALNIENNLQDGEIEELTKELQYFPLALGQAAAYIQDQNEESRLRGDKRFEINDYLKEYQQNAGELLKKGVYENEDRYTKTVLTTWNVTIEAITRKEYGMTAFGILKMMAYLAPDDIRIEEIFYTTLIVGLEEMLWNAVKLLDRYSMISLTEKVINIHRLVQKVARLELQNAGHEEKTLREAFLLINGGDITHCSIKHVVSVWEYASKHGKLIDKFYFNSVYSECWSTPLHLLAKDSDYKAVEAILTHMKEKRTSRLSEVVNAKDKDGYTPLHLAVRGGKLDAVKSLINKGADVNAKSKFNSTPLHSAVADGKLDIVKYLINRGADVNAKRKGGNTPLHWAVIRWGIDVARILLEHNADVNDEDDEGATVLHYAIIGKNLEVVKYIIEKGANVNAKDKYGNTPLYMAVEGKKLDMVEHLINKGASVNAKDKYNSAPLHLAADSGELDIVKCLIDKGADINAKDGCGWTPLHCAAESEEWDIVKYLVSKGANINAKNKYGCITLHYAAGSRELDIVKCLIKNGTDVNTKSEDGNTPLHHSAFFLESTML
ncbi:MAG: ankyrin repeat domain-containing protein [Wolbachia sp.]